VYSEIGRELNLRCTYQRWKELKRSKEELELFTGNGELILVVDDEATIRDY